MTSPEGAGWRASVKAALPPGAGRLLAGARAYARRLGIWGLVVAQVRGDGARGWGVLAGSALAAPVTALGGLDRWRHPVLLADARLAVPGVGRFDCRARGDDLWHVLPGAQPAVWAAVGAHLRPGDVFVDAGANIGVLALLGARRVGPGGRVVAIEMMPETAARLRATVALNGAGWVTVVEAALADVAGRVVGAVAPPGLSGQARLVAGPGTHRLVTTTLDLACADLGSVALLKLDLEGAEAAALAGAGALLSRTRAVVYEARPGAAPGVEALLAAAGLTPRRIDANNCIATR